MCDPLQEKLFGSVILAIHKHILDHFKAKRLVKPESGIAIIVCFNKNSLRSKCLEAAQAF